MNFLITDTELFQFTQPEHSLGQKVKTEDSYIGCIFGLDFYPETRTWSYGVYLQNRQPKTTEEIWYEASQFKVLNSIVDTHCTALICSHISQQFTQPEYKLGQKVKTEDNHVGYIVGLDFHPKINAWTYGVYLFNSKQELIEEVWYDPNQLQVFNSTTNETGRHRLSRAQLRWCYLRRSVLFNYNHLN
ncbi:MAG TPA: hypothetical protein V6D11_19100 [Waterburya sp.]|jgi:hypothetical protein